MVYNKIHGAPIGITQSKFGKKQLSVVNITGRKQLEEKLQKSLGEISNYKRALDESSIVTITNRQGIIVYANDNFCKISKYILKELIGQDHPFINSVYNPGEFIRKLWITISKGRIWKGELKNKAKNGTYYWLDTTIVPLVNERGKPYQYLAVQTDITIRKKLEEQQSLFESIVNSSEDAIVSKTLDGIITSWNKGAEKLLGYSPKEIIGKHISILIPDHLRSEEIEIVEKISKGKIIAHYETDRIRKDGKSICVSLTISPMKDVAGNIIGASKIARDISGRKEADQKLNESVKIYKTIASNIPGSVICLLDTDLRYLLIEGDMCNKLGFSRNKLLGNKAGDVLSPEIFAGVKKKFRRALNGESITTESTIGQYDIISRFIPLKDKNKAVYAIMTVTIDVTKLKTAQRNITELNRDLEEKIIKRTAQLESVNKELESFSYSVSHDLRGPLRIIDGYGQVLLEDYLPNLDEEGKETIKVIMGSAKKMGQLIDDLLNFSRLGRSEIMMSKVNMNQLVKEVLQELSTGGISIPVKLKLNKLKAVKGDSHLLKQVWSNLISNAIKYSSGRKEPIIEIGTSEEKNKLIYYVKDNGAGFDMQYSDKLFGVFQRLHTGDEFTGTGVGLALAQRIIVRHEGEIWAKAKVNKGAIFYFSLPD